MQLPNDYTDFYLYLLSRSDTISFLQSTDRALQTVI